MKIKKWVKFEDEIDIELTPEEISFCFAENGDPERDALYNLNQIASFLKGIPDSIIDEFLDGQKEEGVEIINRLDTTPMRSYIKGLATNDPADFWKSLEGYMKRGDRLYGLFPAQELKRLGEREDTIEMLYNNTLKEVVRS